MNTLTANSQCHEEYCEAPLTKSTSHSMTFTDIAILGCYALIVLALGAVAWYGTLAGYYPSISLI